jgi:hypothetical protein
MPSFNNQTTLDLNGPILSFTTNPFAASACTSGIATFIGIATATFPTQDPPNPATNTGYISYRWHQVGYGELFDGDLNGTTVAGSATTTLTLSGISSAILFNNSQYFLRADYIPSAYSVSGSDVTAGTARSTGNAINDPKDSETALLTVFPNISIIKQPGITTTVNAPKQSANIRIRDGQGFDFTFSTLDLTSYSNFVPGKQYSIVADKSIAVKVYAIGAGGGTSRNNSGTGSNVRGGKGGAARGTITLEAGKRYVVTVGGKGGDGLGGVGGYGGGGNGTGGGSGGGYTGIFFDAVSHSGQANFPILIAAGGGGGANDFATCYGGDGGGTTGQDSQNAGSRGGFGATQTAGGASGSSGGVAGSALQGGSGSAGGGGGYYGGGGGAVAGQPGADGAGGGGSGYLHPTLVSNGVFDSEGALKIPESGADGAFKFSFELSRSDVATAAQNSTVIFSAEATTGDTSQGDVSYQWQLNEVDLVDGENILSVPKNNNDYPSNALLRLPLWDKNSGSLVLDDLTNVANTVTNTSVNWVSGTGKFYNGYANFTTDSFLTLFPLSDFNFGTGDFTVETWVYFTQTGWNDIFSTGIYGQNQLSIRKNKDSQLAGSPGSEQLEVYYNGTIIASGGQFSLNTWHHVAVTRTTPNTSVKRDSILRLFINGTQVASAIFNDNIRATDAKIGRTTGNVYNMVGRMQDFQIYASSIYTSNFTPSTSAIVDKRLVLALPLWDNATGTLSLTDISSNPKAVTPGITWGSSPTWKTGAGKFYGGSAFFNGYSYLNLPISEDFNFGTGDFTLELWYNPQKGLRTDAGSFGGVGGWEVLINAGGGVYFQENGRGGGTWFALSRSSPLSDSSATTFYLADHASYTTIGQITLNTDRWYHFAVSRNSTSVRFFVNGVLIQSTPIANWSNKNFGGLNVGYIGVEHWGGYHERGYYFPFAYMQDIKIYKGLAKYTSDFTPDETSLVTGLSERVEISTMVSGAQTPNLSIALPNVSKNLLRTKVTHPTACNSPVYTNTAQFDVVPPTSRAVIEVEAYDLNSTTATLREFDLTNLDYTITSSVFDSDTICLYAKDRDIAVEFEMYGAKGEDSDYINPTREPGGEGGYSKIRFTMKKGEEYILKGIKTKTSLYLYRKAQLIACVGQGGKGGHYGAGGRGGGINVAGENGFGRLSGVGGNAIAAGQLSGNGIFGSSSGATRIYSEDSKASGVNGGRTISCTKGVYWRDQGRTACSDLGVSKFRLPDGREVTNSVAINRGFKDGYGINQTAGNASSDGGTGGNGATGGAGGTSGGGGGGSGYTDGSVTIVDTTLGGHSAKETKLVMRLVESIGDFYTDSAGRILIFSAVTPGKDPRTLTKTTGKVLPGTDTCIDDARWQRFLDLALTQDYRLTATLSDGRPTTTAQPFNIRRMINANSIPLKRSLTDWENTNYAYLLLALAWDETNLGGARGYGGDYSIFSMAPGTYYYGYYGESSNSFFNNSGGSGTRGSIYGNTTAYYWILPPGVPDFP